MEAHPRETVVPVAERPTLYRVTLVVLLFLILLVSLLDRVNVSVLVTDNTFLTDMGIKGQPVQMGMLMSVFLFCYGLGHIFLGPVADFIGPRKGMSISVLLWIASMFVGGLAPTFAAMLIARIVLGLGEGMHWPMNNKYIKNWFPPYERGKANSVWILGAWVGPTIAMPFFVWFLQFMSWRDSFFTLGALGLLPLLALWFLTADHPRQSRFVNKLELAHIEDGQKDERAAEALVENRGFWATTKTFIYDYRFWLVTLYYITTTGIFWAMIAWLPSYLKVARGFSMTSMGMLSSLPFALGGVCLLLFGWISDKVGRRAPFCTVGAATCTAAMYLGATASGSMSAALFIVLSVGAIGIGHASILALLQKVVPSRAIGTGAGIMNGLTSIFSALLPILIGYLINVTGSYFAGLMLLVCLGIVGTISMLVMSLRKY